MNYDLLQGLRLRLQKRVRSLNSSSYQRFHSQLRQFWHFLRSEPLLANSMDALDVTMAHMEKAVSPILNESDEFSGDSYDVLNVDTEHEYIAVCYFILKACCSDAKNKMKEVEIGLTLGGGSKLNESLDNFRDLFLEPFYEYLDENLDTTHAVLALLRKYKHRCEWFHRERLLNQYLADTQHGEDCLARDMYEYLFDQGLNLYIEPRSESGRIDLITDQVGEDRLVADAKIFDVDRNKSKSNIVSGYRQTYDYMKDFNEPVGYLVIFKTSEHDLQFSLPGLDQKTPFLIYNGKTIFFITIDLHGYSQSASKRGQLKAFEITEKDLISIE